MDSIRFWNQPNWDEIKPTFISFYFNWKNEQRNKFRKLKLLNTKTPNWNFKNELKLLLEIRVEQFQVKTAEPAQTRSWVNVALERAIRIEIS